MIGKLIGRLDYRASDHALIDVGGVGYIVHCSDRTLAGLPGPGQPVTLYTDLLVREDLMQLFGFATMAEKEWHKLLTSVQGVGARASLAILGALGPDATGRAIALGDWNAIRAAKGVGPKLAQRVVQELKDKAPQVMAMGGEFVQGSNVVEPSTGGTSAAPAVREAAPSLALAQAEALSALANLGYGPGDAARAVAEAAQDGGATDTAALIRAALKLLAPAS